jgi:RNA polymerase sigma-70 factor, ECF subfamily
LGLVTTGGGGEVHHSRQHLTDEIVASVPRLRAFAISLAHDPDVADDLVQDTILKAWNSLDQFERGTNLHAWLFCILRNAFYSRHRKRRREAEDPDDRHAASLKTAPEQTAHLEFADLRQALARLSVDHREAILLVAAEGLPYEEAAQVCGVAVGTIKSRVSRARRHLAELMHIESVDDLGTDRVLMSVMSA